MPLDQSRRAERRGAPVKPLMDHKKEFCEAANPPCGFQADARQTTGAGTRPGPPGPAGRPHRTTIIQFLKGLEK